MTLRYSTCLTKVDQLIYTTSGTLASACPSGISCTEHNLGIVHDAAAYVRGRVPVCRRLICYYGATHDGATYDIDERDVLLSAREGFGYKSKGAWYVDDTGSALNYKPYYWNTCTQRFSGYEIIEDDDDAGVGSFWWEPSVSEKQVIYERMAEIGASMPDAGEVHTLLLAITAMRPYNLLGSTTEVDSVLYAWGAIYTDPASY